MTSGWGNEFFSRYTPLVRDGRPARAEDGLLIFVRAADGEYVRFHDSQVHMDELDQYIRNGVITKTSEVGSVADPTLDHQISGVGLRAKSDDAGLVQEQEPVNQQNQHNLQVQLTLPNSQMQDLMPHTLHTLHDVLQMQVSQKHHQQQQLQQQQSQRPGTSQTTFIPTQSSLHLEEVQQHFQIQQQYQQQKLALTSPKNLSQPVSSDLTSHIEIDPQISEKQELTTENSNAMEVVTSVDTALCNNVPVSSHSSCSSVKSSIDIGLENNSTNNCSTYNYLSRKDVNSQSRITTIASTSGQLPSDVVWMNIKTPEQRLRDKQATQALIGIVSRPDVQGKLSTRSTKKKAVWREIGEEMGHLGFIFENPGDKCSQKWRNIERSFKDYELSKKIPDMGPKRLPEFYAELSQILKEKHTYDSINLRETDEEGLNNQQLLREYVTMETSSDLHTQSSGGSSAEACMFPGSHQTTTSSGNTNTITSPSQTFSCLGEKNNTEATYQGFSSLSHQTSVSSFLPAPHLPKQATPPTDIATLLTAIHSNKQEISKLQSLISSVHNLLEEQRRDRDAMRAESRLRFTELRSLIEQNQKEKMKFMYDFLKTIQLGKGSRKRGGCKARFLSSTDK